MGRREQYLTELRTLPTSQWAAHLQQHSGLPGPRANIELAQAVADEGDAACFDEFAGSGDEYLTFCAVLGLGRLLTEGTAVEDRLRGYARDSRWRVREAAAMALQHLGDADPPRLFHLADAWAADPDPLVQRAALAAVCEPRLLRTADAAAHAVDICATVTRTLADRPRSTRRDPGVRTLRQALGYCWSVAVAADPASGLPRFHALADYDPDVAWIIKENTKKARLAKLL